MRCAKSRRGCVELREGWRALRLRGGAHGPGGQPGAKQFGLHVAERDGQRVGGVRGLGRFAHAQKRAHHQLHLLLGRVPVAGHGSFYFARRVAAHGDASLRRGQQNHAANFGQPQGRFHIESGEDRFDGDAVRLKLLDQRGEHGMNFAQAFGKMFRALARGAQRAEAQHAAAAAVAFNHAVSGGAGRGGIDAEHAEEIAIGSGRERHGIECTAARRARPQFFRGMWHTLQPARFCARKSQKHTG